MLTRNDIAIEMTKKANEYINNGYVFSMRTMNGSDGTFRLDLVKGDKFIRIWSENNRIKGNHYSYADCLLIKVGTTKVNPKTIHTQDIVWSKNLDIVDEITYYVIGNVYGNCCYGNKEEYDAFIKKNDERLCNYSFSNTTRIKLGQNASKIVFDYVKSKPKCKTIKLSDIRVEKQISNNKNVTYVVYAKNQHFVLA